MSRCFIRAIFLILFCESSGKSILTKTDRFSRTYTQTFQKFIDSLGNEWERKTDANKLEVLLNDRLEVESYKTCQQANSQNKSNESKSNKTYEEVAQVTFLLFC